MRTLAAVAPVFRRLRLLPAVVVGAAAFWLAVPEATGRVVRSLSYQELLDKSDLVAIATPSARTADTGEELVLPGISTMDGQGRTEKVKCLGVETPFVVSAVLKGDRNLRKFTLHHGRWPPEVPAVNGSALVFFDPRLAQRSGSYLLFLVREPDGRYAPTGGQTDPGMAVISRLPFEDLGTRPY
ncbi:hypothetical protein [Paludibaculum fermentans]|uniref:Uncharacterized protein n=1 Tax=Paludibaculum fermentans TaxID=1473598 RepID=A0A7S7NU24_PALFE|nr:hypothetical protein [Paludibaculum fermentans]QOY89836.1 hypothetical protein IRI77_07750 [Paludibaculum fermentans]